MDICSFEPFQKLEKTEMELHATMQRNVTLEEQLREAAEKTEALTSELAQKERALSELLNSQKCQEEDLKQYVKFSFVRLTFSSQCRIRICYIFQSVYFQLFVFFALKMFFGFCLLIQILESQMNHRPPKKYFKEISFLFSLNLDFFFYYRKYTCLKIEDFDTYQ